MKIEIDDDCVDKIVQAAIVWNYVHLTDDLKNNKGLHPEDYDNYRNVVDALQVLAKWFFVDGEFEKAVKKERKNLK